MPAARWGHVAAAVDGIIYAIGGMNAGGADVSTVEAYEPATDTWTTKADMPSRRAHVAIDVVDGKIYVIGGIFGETPQDNRALSAVEAYDPATDTWTRKADMPTARNGVGACVVDGRIYVSGGWDGNNHLATMEVYDPATDTWTQASDMPRTRSFHTASVVVGKIYIIGGGDHWVHPRGAKVVDVYDPATDTWTTAADFPTTRVAPTAGVVDGKIYAIGGWRGPGTTIYSTVEEFDPGLPSPISNVSPAGKLLETWGQIKKVQ
jgi:N-acetylneuraminic acid mutarotase